MQNLRLRLAAAALVSCISAAAWAHHSRGNFDLENTVELQGTITEFSWRNPHTFATLAVENDDGSGLQVDYTFEDPVYLTEPVELARTFFLDAGYPWQDYNCDRTASSRHLDVE